MERAAFDLLQRIERSWWYRGRADAVRRMLLAAKQPFSRALDFGAGFGGMRGTLAQFAASVDAMEPDEEARAEACTRGYRATYSSLAETSAPYDLIGLFDVLEHMQDEQAFLRELRAHLAPGGHLAITVPAYQWMWSPHDVANHHFRRYSAGTLVRALTDGGFAVRYAGYWNASLLLPAIGARFLGRQSGESALALPEPINSTLLGVIALENRLIPHMRLPFGTGVVALARRDG